MKKPIIGIVEYLNDSDEKNLKPLVPLVKSILSAGGLPMGIFVTLTNDLSDQELTLDENEKQEIIEYIDACDAIIKPDALKLFSIDRFIYNYTIEKNIPFLGIGSAIKIMASHRKNAIQSIEIEENKLNHKVDDYNHVHEVNLLPGKLKKALNKETIMVSSNHSYRIPNGGINILSARSEDGVIEAIENRDCDFNIGLQWHPELMPEDENSKIIFKTFVDAADNYSLKKTQK